jgi:hypothetical protein
MVAEEPKQTFFQLYPASPRYRLVATLVGLAALSILLTAVYVQPVPDGNGSQRELDLRECSWSQRDLACPTCGMTRAFAFAVRGRLGQAFFMQPAGTLAALLCGLIVLYGFFVILLGQRLDLFSLCFHYKKIATVIVAIVLFSWLWRWVALKYVLG